MRLWHLASARSKKDSATIVATPVATVVVVLFVVVPVVALPTRPRHFRRRCPRLLRRLIVGVFVIAFVVVCTSSPPSPSPL